VRSYFYLAAAASVATAGPVPGIDMAWGQASPLAAQAALVWQAADRQALLDEIDQSASEGLEPARYDGAALRAAMENRSPDLDAIAERSALRLAHDYAEGGASGQARTGWFIGGEAPAYREWLAQALSRHDLRASFRALLPHAAAYEALREALPSCDTAGHCATLKVNLDRWRWLPRALGYHYLWVNAPAFRLDLIENEHAVSSHRIIVGKTKSPTPSFAAAVTGVTANPWWTVPESIVAESVGAAVRDHPAEAAEKGYVAIRDQNGRLHVRQQPGPKNALGQVKLEMPNPYSIFIHDTPARALFAEPVRAFSHGCIRTERPDQLARVILSSAGAASFDRAYRQGENRTIALDAPVPVYVVYLTAEPDASAPGGVRYHDDVYRRDDRIAAALSR